MKVLVVLLLVSCVSRQEPTAKEESVAALRLVLGQSSEFIEEIIVQVSKGRKGKLIGIVRSILTRPDRVSQRIYRKDIGK